MATSTCRSLSAVRRVALHCGKIVVREEFDPGYHPSNFDQPFWGQRVAQLGVGPAPILRLRLMAEGLARAIRVACTDEAMRQRAADLGARMRTEDGVRRAVEIIERLYGG